MSPRQGSSRVIRCSGSHNSVYRLLTLSYSQFCFDGLFDIEGEHKITKLMDYRSFDPFNWSNYMS